MKMKETESGLLVPAAPHDKYRGSHGVPFESQGGGRLSIGVLEFLNGIEWGPVPLAYVEGLRPSSLRVTTGEETTDSYLHRVTVHVNSNDIILHISQEVATGGNCSGSELRRRLREEFEKRDARLKAQGLVLPK